MTKGTKTSPWYHPVCRKTRPLLKTFVTQGKRRNLFRKLRGGLQNRLQTFLSAKRKALCVARFLIIPIKAYFIILNYNRLIITATKAFVKQINFKNKKTETTKAVSVFYGALQGTRTPGLLIRSQSLYPTELATQGCGFSPHLI